MKKPTNKSRLRRKIVKSNVPLKQDASVLDTPEDFLPGFIHDLQTKITLPDFDISSPDAALKTFNNMSKQLETLNSLQSQAKGLKSLLEQKKIKMN